MDIQNDKARQISLLQDNLQTLRRLTGWTVDELGARIGVTKQTVSNLENKKTRMSQTQYIAIRTVLDYEIEEHPENEVLRRAVSLLLDEGENLSEADYAKVKLSVETVAAAAAGGAEKTVLSTLFSSLVGTAVIGAGIGALTPLGMIGGAIGSVWLRNLLNREDKKEQ